MYTVVDEDVYYYTYAKVAQMPLNKKCHLIICKKTQGYCFIGYALDTYGFPFYEGVHPAF